MFRINFRRSVLKHARAWSDVNKASGTAPPGANIPPPPPEKASAPPPKPVEAKTDYIADDEPKVLLNINEVQTAPQTDAFRRSVPFDDVPGPQFLRQMSKVWTYVPVIGTHVTASAIQYLLSAGKLFGSQLSWGNNLWLFRYLLDEYGPVVRLHGPFGGDVVILSRPEHVGAVFQNEGRYPIRSSLDCIEKYRLQYRKYKHAGPFLMFGPEWEKLRQNVEQAVQNLTEQHFNHVDDACEDFIKRIIRIRNRQDEVPPDFKKEINKWSLDCLTAFMLNKRLGFLEIAGIGPTSEPGRLLDGLTGATDAIRRCEFGLHMWKFIETPAWKSLVKYCDSIDSVLNKYIHKAQRTLREKKTSDVPMAIDQISLLESLLVCEGVTPEDVLTILLDMLIVGVNSVSHSVSFLMYHLARSPRVQHRLYKEIANGPPVTDFDTLKGMPYLGACIKESLRLKPPMPVLSRVLSKEVVVHNYRIPKGTYVLIATHLSSLREEHFEDAQRFIPERWLEDGDNPLLNSFASIPFGHGPKACLARDLAEMQISLLMTKVLLKFRIEYHYGDIRTTNKLLAAPDRPLKFRFVERMA